MTLRLRLILAFLAMVALLIGVGVSSLFHGRRIQHQVARLGSSAGVDLRRVDLGKVGLEIEGFYEPGERFVATDIEVVPGRRRPVLRGAIQAIDAAAGTLTVFGRPIVVSDKTEFEDFPDKKGSLAELSVGQRIEVTCDVEEEGLWQADEIETDDIKRDDKIKGTASQWEIDGQEPETLEFHGLVVGVAPTTDVAPEGSLRRIEMATHMALSLKECTAVAHELLGGRPASQHQEAESNIVPRSLEQRLLDAKADFDYYLNESLMAGAVNSPASEYARALRPLSEKRERLDKQIETLRELAATDPQRGEEYVSEVLDPYVEEQLLPLVYAYLSQAEEDLGDQLRAIVDNMGATTRVAFTTSAVALVLAFVLGFLVWRSINRPILALHKAALMLGAGHLDTRVSVRTRDEMGDLAKAFNHMASDLAATTVSVENLESVIDSMAGALLLLDPGGRITNVNRAALELLGYARGDLIDRTFTGICRRPEGVRPGEGASMAEVLDEQEVLLRRADGSEVPVSFAAAELRSRGGPLQGYVCVAQDLTDRKRMEEQLRSSLSRQELLFREVHHRVKNNMQVISSMLAMQALDIKDPHSLEQFEQSQSRIRSMALIHEQLYQSSDLAAIDFAAYLQTLTQHLGKSIDHDGRLRIDLDVEPVILDIDQSLACGLVVNELVTNARKHAFGEAGKGTISVRFHQDAEGLRHLVVADDGKGVPDVMTNGRNQSLGMRLVKTLAKQLRGTLSVDGSRGTRIELVFPPAPRQTPHP